MKNRIDKVLCLVAVFLISVMWGCEKDLEEYSGLDYIYFSTDITKDSLTYCFGLAGVEDQDTLGLEMKVSGMPAVTDREYKVSIAKNSGLEAGSDIVVLNPVFRGNRVVDTLWVVVRNSDKLKQGEYLLQLDLVANEHFSLCFPKQNSAKIYLTDKIEIPEWWDETQVNEGLGVYSETKYRLFIRVCRVTGFGDLEYPERRDAILRFRKYLDEEAEKGNVILDEDGRPMKVTIYG